MLFGEVDICFGCKIGGNPGNDTGDNPGVDRSNEGGFDAEAISAGGGGVKREAGEGGVSVTVGGERNCGGGEKDCGDGAEFCGGGDDGNGCEGGGGDGGGGCEPFDGGWVNGGGGECVGGGEDWTGGGGDGEGEGGGDGEGEGGGEVDGVGGGEWDGVGGGGEFSGTGGGTDGGGEEFSGGGGDVESGGGGDGNGDDGEGGGGVFEGGEDSASSDDCSDLDGSGALTESDVDDPFDDDWLAISDSLLNLKFDDTQKWQENSKKQKEGMPMGPMRLQLETVSQIGCSDQSRNSSKNNNMGSCCLEYGIELGWWSLLGQRIVEIGNENASTSSTRSERVLRGASEMEEKKKMNFQNQWPLQKANADGSWVMNMLSSLALI